jgi:ABC-type uncharacterized transport system permease subunit
MKDKVGAMGRRGKVCGSTVITGCVLSKTVAGLLLHTQLSADKDKAVGITVIGNAAVFVGRPPTPQAR